MRFETILKQNRYNKYKITRNSDKIYIIQCKYGEIGPNSVDGSRLAYYDYSWSHRRFNNLVKKLLPGAYELNRSDEHIQIVFPAEDIEKYEKLFSIKKRRVYSEEALVRLKDNMLKNRKV